MSYNHFPRQRAKDKMFEMSFHMIRVGGRGLYSFRPKEKWKFARKVLFGPHFTCKDVMHRAESAETIKTVLRDVSHVQCPEFKFRFVFFPLQKLRFSALCKQIWQQFWGTYDLRSS